MLVRAKGLNLYAKWQTRGPRINPRHLGFAQSILGKYGFTFSAFPRSLDLVFRMYPGLGSRVGDTWHSLVVNLRLQLLQNQYQPAAEPKRSISQAAWEQDRSGGYYPFFTAELVLQRFRDYLFSVNADREAGAGAEAPAGSRRPGTNQEMDVELAEKIIRMYLGGIETPLTLGQSGADDRGDRDSSLAISPVGENRAVPLRQEPALRFIPGTMREWGTADGFMPGVYMGGYGYQKRDLIYRQRAETESRGERVSAARPLADERLNIAESERKASDRTVNTNLAESIIIDQIQRVQRLLHLNWGDGKGPVSTGERPIAEGSGSNERARVMPDRAKVSGQASTAVPSDDINRTGPGFMVERGFPGPGRKEDGTVLSAPAMSGQWRDRGEPAAALDLAVPGVVQPGRTSYIRQLNHLVQREIHHWRGIGRVAGERGRQLDPITGEAMDYRGINSIWRSGRGELDHGYSQLLFQTLMFPINQEVINKGLAYNQQVYQNLALQRASRELLSFVREDGGSPQSSMVGERSISRGLPFYREEIDAENTAARHVWSDRLSGEGWGYRDRELVYRQQAETGYQERGIPLARPVSAEQPAMTDGALVERTRDDRAVESGMAERLILSQFKQMQSLLHAGSGDGSFIGTYTENFVRERIPVTRREAPAERVIESSPMTETRALRVYAQGTAGADSASEYNVLAQTFAYPISIMRDRLGQRDIYRQGERVFTAPGAAPVRWLTQGSQLIHQVHRDIYCQGDRVFTAPGATPVRWLTQGSLTHRVQSDNYRQGERAFTNPGATPMRWLTQGNQLTHQVQRDILRWREATREARDYPSAGKLEIPPVVFKAYDNNNGSPNPSLLTRLLSGGAVGETPRSVLQILNQGLPINQGVINRELTYNRQSYLNQILQQAGEAMLRTVQGVEPASQLPFLYEEPRVNRGIHAGRDDALSHSPGFVTGTGAVAQALSRGTEYLENEMVHRQWVGSSENEREKSLSTAWPLRTEIPVVFDGSMIDTIVKAEPLGNAAPYLLKQQLQTIQAGGYYNRFYESGDGVGSDRQGWASTGTSKVHNLTGRLVGYRAQTSNPYPVYIKAAGEGLTTPLILQRQIFLQRSEKDEQPVSTARPVGSELVTADAQTIDRVMESRLLDREILEQVKMQRQSMRTDVHDIGAPEIGTVRGIDRRGSVFGTAPIVHNMTGHLTRSSAQFLQAFSAYPKAVGDGTTSTMTLRYQTRDTIYNPLLLSGQPRERGSQGVGANLGAANTLVKNRYATDPTGYGRLTALENVVRQVRGLNEVRYGSGTQSAPAAPLDHRRETLAPASEGRYITGNETMNRRYIQTETSISPASVPVQNGLTGVDVKRIADQIIREVEQKTRFDRKRRGL